jgi:hypothetical protein
MSVQIINSNIEVYGAIMKLGGTSSQFLKADGSVDDTAYAAASSLGSHAYKSFWQGTKAEYDALGVYYNNTVYYIEEEGLVEVTEADVAAWNAGLWSSDGNGNIYRETGNVGIGTTEANSIGDLTGLAGSNFQVYSGTSNGRMIVQGYTNAALHLAQLSAATNDRQWRFLAANSRLDIGQPSDNFSVSNTIITLIPTGNVGILQTNPAYTLDVTGNGRFTATVKGADAVLNNEFVTLLQLTSALTGYATESWVTSQNYITAAALTGYATESWVNSNFDNYNNWKLYVDDAVVSTILTGARINFKGGDNITLSWNAGFDNLTISAAVPSLAGYATESWVTSNFDKYNKWIVAVDGVSKRNIQSGFIVDFLSGTNVTLDWSDLNGTLTINASGGTSPWTTDTNGIHYSSGNVGIGKDSSTLFSLTTLNDINSDNGYYLGGYEIMLYNLASNSLGTAGQVLTMVSGSPAWATPSDGGLWTADTSGITYQSGNVGIGAASSASNMLNIYKNSIGNAVVINKTSNGEGIALTVSSDMGAAIVATASSNTALAASTSDSSFFSAGFSGGRGILCDKLSIGSIGTHETILEADGSLQLVTLSDSAAGSNSLYYSSTQSKLVYKDSGGTVHSLY